MKNDHFKEMFKPTISKELRPEAVLADTWSSSLDKLKMLCDADLN